MMRYHHITQQAGGPQLTQAALDFDQAGSASDAAVVREAATLAGPPPHTRTLQEAAREVNRR